MNHILFIAPDTELFASAKRLQKRQFPEVKVVQGFLGEGVRLAAKHSRQGMEIFITRGRTASLLREAALPGVIVEVPFTVFDYLRAITKARYATAPGTVIGAVVFPEMAPQAQILKELLELNLEIALIETETDGVGALEAMLKKGVGVVIGGMAARKAASELNVPFVALHNGDEAITQALEEAMRIGEMRALEETKTHVLQTVIDHTVEGVIITDAALQIVQFSPPAGNTAFCVVVRTMAGKPGAAATENPNIKKLTSHGPNASPLGTTGKNLGDIWPELRGKKAFPRNDVVMGERITFNGTECLCNRMVIRVGETVTALVIMFQEVEALRSLAVNAGKQLDGSLEEHTAEFRFDMLCGDSSLTHAVINEAKEYALTESPICITGETGTGKSVFAESIHNYSRRMDGPFVTINCGQLSTRHLSRHFSGKTEHGINDAESGIFDEAFGGTLYFDEISDLAPDVQVQLAGILQQKRNIRSASGRPALDVRIITSTRHDIAERIREGRFNANLFYLLNVLQISLPTLDERKEDIPALARHFLQLAAMRKKTPLLLDEDAMMLLYRYSWSGNVRELDNIIERIAAASRGGQIPRKLVRNILEKNRPHNTTAVRDLIRDDALEQIRQALRESKGRYHVAAAKLGIDRSTLWRRMKKYGLK